MEFGAYRWIDFEVAPRVVNDLLEIGQVLIVSDDEGDSRGGFFLFVGEQTASVL